jgi:flagellar biosynthetic protein FliS
MLTEGCLKFLEKAISAGENSAEKEGADVSSMGENIERAQKIIAYQKVTLDHSVKGGVTRTLGDLYEFSIRHLISAKAERDVTKVAEVRGIIKKIYEGNLEVEIQQDAEKFIKARASAKQGRSDSCAF